MFKFNVGDSVKFTSRKGLAIGVVDSRRTIQRGRHAGTRTYKVSITNIKAHAEVPEHFLKASEVEVSAEEAAAARKQSWDIRNRNDDRRRERKQSGRDAINLAEVLPGDKILIKGRDCADWTATVLEVRKDLGKVSIAAPRRKSGSRLIKGQSIKKVIRQKKPAPFKKFTERMFDEICDQGYTRVQFGSEFIERSLIVAFKKSTAASRRFDYECAENTVYFDEKWGVYWRSTGSFD